MFPFPSPSPSTLLPDLNILPSRNATRIRSRQRIKSQTIVNITRRHSRILNGGKHLPRSLARGVIGARHKPVCAEAGGAVCAEWLALDPVKGTLLGPGGHGDRVWAGVGDGAAGFHVQGLAAGDFDVLDIC